LSDNRPLDDDELEKLRVVRQLLVKEMNGESLLAPLMMSKCINALHLSAIMEYDTTEGINGELLDIVQRRGVHQYKQFLQCLHDTGQDHIVQQINNCKGKSMIDSSYKDNFYTTKSGRNI